MTTEMTGIQKVLDNIRPSFEYNVSFVYHFLTGKGLDMGCGNCPLLHEDCLHIDAAPQPLAVEQVGEGRVILGDAVNFEPPGLVDFVFSSHMVEDLPTKEAMVDCISKWVSFVKPEGFIVLLIPDMEGGRYPKVGEDCGNPSHRIDVGKDFFMSIYSEIQDIAGLVQIDTIPHDRSCTMDVVFRRKNG